MNPFSNPLRLLFAIAWSGFAISGSIMVTDSLTESPVTMEETHECFNEPEFGLYVCRPLPEEPPADTLLASR